MNLCGIIYPIFPFGFNNCSPFSINKKYLSNNSDLPFHILKLQIYNIHIHFQKNAPYSEPEYMEDFLQLHRIFLLQIRFPNWIFYFFNLSGSFNILELNSMYFSSTRLLPFLILLSKLGKIRQLLFLQNFPFHIESYLLISFIKQTKLSNFYRQNINIYSPYIIL